MSRAIDKLRRVKRGES